MNSLRMKSPLLNHRTTVFALLMIVLVVCLTINPRSGAQNKRLPKRSGHINDFAEVLDAATKSRLEKVLDNLKEKSGVDFVVVTVKTTGGEDLYEYSLQAAGEWNVGAPSGVDKSVLIVLAADTRKFFSQVTRGARLYLPDGVIGEMGQRMRQKIETAGFSEGLLTGVRTFVNAAGEIHNFDFASMDPKSGETLIAEQQRPRTVASPVAEPNASPSPAATEVATATPAPTETPSPRPAETPAQTPTPEAKATPTPSPQASPSTPTDTVSPQPSPNASPETVAENSARPTKTPAPDRKTNATPANPEDEKEQVELTLTLPLDKRIDALKSFIATHPNSVALSRAGELLVVAHAMLGDQKMQASDAAGGLEQFRAAIAEAPADMSDRLFTEVIARIPMNLFVRGQRDAAYETARQAEALAKTNAKRLLALDEFYLAIENPTEAARIADAAIHLAPDSPAAHQTLGAVRHIDLRLDEAEKEYARALELDPKLSAARVALADLKRASGKTEEALALYRALLQAEPKNNRARAGLILSLFELGKKEEAETELGNALKDEEQARNLPLLVGAAYWFIAHNDAERGLDLAQKAVAIEPRYSWAQVALERALVATKRPVDAEGGVRFARQYGRFPTLDYEVANVLAAIGLYDEAAQELARS